MPNDLSDAQFARARCALSLAQVKEAVARFGDGRPALVLDLARVRENARRFARAMPSVRPYYAVKANPDRGVLLALAQEGAGFEIASPSELDLVRSIGVPAADIFYSNPVRSPEAIEYAARRGVQWYVFDCVQELAKFARLKPDARLYLRIETSNEGSDWPLTGKFGAAPSDIDPIIEEATRLKLDIAGVTFHVGSQCRNPENWRIAIRSAHAVFERLAAAGLRPRLLDLGGGFPVQLTEPTPAIEPIGALILPELARFDPDVQVIAEPGRFMVADAGCFVARVIGTAMRNGQRWMHWDAGVFGGLFETTDGLRYNLHADRDGTEVAWNVAGPTCDSVDVCLRGQMLPDDVVEGDLIYVLNAGAYTTAYASQFNGFPPPQVIVIDSAED
ncbi:MAG TPA: type III PLP-dependent enzyme [Burkholderiaceae bacterium]|jgi:ornithine decarboxylase|nr:type III PLP-dependent enzyme [Burkholderiaceae bacterium]